MTENLMKVFKACGFNGVDENLSQDLDKIITWQKELRKVDIESVKPMLTTIGDNERYIFNDDTVSESNNDKILSNAPQQDDNFFLVPKVIKS